MKGLSSATTGLIVMLSLCGPGRGFAQGPSLRSADGPLAAQQPSRAVLRALVEDELGGILVGAKVTLLEIASQRVRDVASDDEGRVAFEGLVPGEYTLKAEAPGFRTLEQRVTIGRELLRPLRLQLKIEIVEQVDVTESRRVRPQRGAIDQNADTVPVDNDLVQGLPMPANGKGLVDFLSSFLSPSAGRPSIFVDGQEVSGLSLPKASINRSTVAPVSETSVESSLSDPLDPQWLKERLFHYLWRDNEIPGDVVHVEMLQGRESPGKAVKSLCQVTLRGCDDRLVEQTYLGSRLPDAPLRAKYESWLSNATVVPAIGRPVILIPEANLVLQALPDSRRMRSLTQTDLTTWLAERATNLANGRPGLHWGLKEIEVRLMHHRPERLTVRCRGVFEADDGTEQSFAYIARQFEHKKRASALCLNLVSLGKHFEGSPTVHLPRVVAFDKQAGLVVMEELSGKQLTRMLHDVELDHVMRAVGDMLATLHLAPDESARRSPGERHCRMSATRHGRSEALLRCLSRASTPSSRSA